MRRCQRRHELTPKHLGQRMHREQEVGLACRGVPLTIVAQRSAGHHRMQVNVTAQVLGPGVQHQAECGRTTGHTHPLRVGGKLRQGLRRAGKQRVDYPARVRAIQCIQTVRQRKHQMRIRHRQHFSQSALQPGILGARAALRAVPVAARVVLPVAVTTSITRQLLATECSGATRDNAPPGFGLRGAQGARCQIRWAKLAQRIGQGGHAITAVKVVKAVKAKKCLQLGQASEQVQWVNILGWAKLWADQVQVATGGTDVAVAQQFLDGEQVHSAF